MIIEPESIRPRVLSPQITISPSLAEPTNLCNKLGFDTSFDFGLPNILYELASSVCPLTEEVTGLKAV